MDMRKKTREIRLAHWEALINERLASGKTIVKFCEEQGIAAKTYYYWLNRLREAAYVKLNTGTNSFTEVTLPAVAEVSAVQKKLSYANIDGPGEVHIDVSGIRIVADGMYPPANLAELIVRLKEPC